MTTRHTILVVDDHADARGEGGFANGEPAQQRRRHRPAPGATQAHDAHARRTGRRIR